MTEAAHFDGHSTEQVSDVLETLETGVFCITFSERGKRQNEEVRKFKEAVHVLENKEKFRLFCKDLIHCIGSCIGAPTRSVDSRREKSYLFSMRKGYHSSITAGTPWDAFHMALHLPQPDPVWTQTVVGSSHTAR